MQIPGPHNVRFNALKHHIREISALMTVCTPEELPQRLKTLGNAQMDLYLGLLGKHTIILEILQALGREGISNEEEYAAWLQQQGGFRTITLSDSSVWVLRKGEDRPRYIHLHPGRHSPFTIRVKAAVLKTVIVLCLYQRHQRIAGIDEGTLNRLRGEVLGLPPLKTMAESRQILRLLEILGADHP
jgi:hypothetical protein